MPQQSHDHNFKNLFLDFPKESLEWLFPQAQENWGPVRNIEFVRQEPKKRKLSDPSLVLDLPILFTFDDHQLLLWLVEFQEDKAPFSIHKLLRYTTDLMEAYPKAMVIPTVLFTDRKKWRKPVLQQLETQFNDRLFLHFEYLFFKLFDFKAREYYNVDNPVVKILLPKMSYERNERIEVIRRAYVGLYQLAPTTLFNKYIDFIDVYAKINPEERDALYQEIVEHQETAMLAQFIREKGKQEGLLQGKQEGLQQGMLQTSKAYIIEVLELRFGKVSDDIIHQIQQINDPDKLKNLLRKAIQLKKMDRSEFFC
jgi:hypothetical protein